VGYIRYTLYVYVIPDCICSYVCRSVVFVDSLFFRFVYVVLFCTFSLYRFTRYRVCSVGSLFGYGFTIYIYHVVLRSYVLRCYRIFTMRTVAGVRVPACRLRYVYFTVAFVRLPIYVTFTIYVTLRCALLFVTVYRSVTYGCVTHGTCTRFRLYRSLLLLLRSRLCRVAAYTLLCALRAFPRIVYRSSGGFALLIGWLPRSFTLLVIALRYVARLFVRLVTLRYRTFAVRLILPRVRYAAVTFCRFTRFTLLLPYRCVPGFDSRLLAFFVITAARFTLLPHVTLYVVFVGCRFCVVALWVTFCH